MCKVCQQNEINPEFESILHEDEFTGEAVTSATAYEGIVIKINEQLNRRFSNPDDPGLYERRNELRRLFTTVPAANAKTLHDRLQSKTDTLSNLFWYKLSGATCNEMIAILRSKFMGTIPSSPVPAPPVAPAPPPPPTQVQPTPVSGIQRYRAILPYIQKYKDSVPLNLIMGWVKVESGGDIKSYTSLDERGYFQLHPEESKQLKIDHKRLSSDPEYSVFGGLQLIKYYASRVQKTLGYNPSQDIFWKLVKFYHGMGSGSLKIIFDDIKAMGARITTWQEFKTYLTIHGARLMSQKRLRFDPPRFILNVEKVFTYGDQIIKQL